MALEHIERRAQFLRARRQELGLTQEQVAERMHAAKAKREPDGSPDRTRGQMVSDWERCVNAPRDEKLPLLADALETTVEAIQAARTGPPPVAPDLLGALSPNGAESPTATDQGLRDVVEQALAAMMALAEQLEVLDRRVGDLDGFVREHLRRAEPPGRGPADQG